MILEPYNLIKPLTDLVIIINLYILAINVILIIRTKMKRTIQTIIGAILLMGCTLEKDNGLVD